MGEHKVLSCIAAIFIALIAISCIATAHETYDNKERINIFQNMHGIEKDFRVNFVLSIEKDPSRNRAKIITHQSGMLWLDEQKVDNYIEVMHLIRSAMREKRPLKIRYESETKEIDFVNYALIDFIPGVEDFQQAGDCIRVATMKRPTSLHLYKNHPRFAELYDRLLQAKSSFESSGMEATKAIIANDIEVIEDVLLKIPEKNNDF